MAYVFPRIYRALHEVSTAVVGGATNTAQNKGKALEINPADVRDDDDVTASEVDFATETFEVISGLLNGHPDSP